MTVDAILARLQAVDACTRLVYSYADLLDRGGRSGVAELFAPGGEWHAPGTDLIGREQIHAFFTAAPTGWLTRHVCSNVMIDLAGPTSAVGLTTVTVYRSEAEASGPYRPEVLPGQLSDYRDEFVLLDHEWKIRRRIVDIKFRKADYQIRGA